MIIKPKPYGLTGRSIIKYNILKISSRARPENKRGVHLTNSSERWKMELTNSKVQDTRKVKKSEKKPYHTPKLGVCGSVRQSTRTGSGNWTDTVTTLASVVSG